MNASDSIQAVRQIFSDGGWEPDDELREQDLSQSCHATYWLKGWNKFIHGEFLTLNLRKCVENGKVEFSIYQFSILANKITLDFNDYDSLSDPTGYLFFIELISKLSMHRKGKFYKSIIIKTIVDSKKNSMLK